MQKSDKISASRQKKQVLIDELATELEKAKSVTFLNFEKMGVKAQQELKKRLKEAKSKMLIVKNTLLKLAGEKSKLPKESLDSSVLNGQTAVVLTEADPVAPISVLGKFMKEFELPQFKVAIVEGTFQEKDKVILLSQLPGKDILLNQAFSAITSPLYSLINTLEAKMQEVIYILKTKGGEA